MLHLRQAAVRRGSAVSAGMFGYSPCRFFVLAVVVFHWIADVRPTVRLASPIVVAQLAMIGSRTADTIMAGRLSGTDLAAVATGLSYWMILGLMMIGLANGVSAIVAQRDGAGDPRRQIGGFVHECAWLGLWMGVGMAVLLAVTAGPVTAVLGLSEFATAKARGYLLAVAWGAPAMGALLVLRFGAEGVSDTRPFMVIGLAGLLANIGLNYVFMYCAWGLPALGAVGCGIATALTDALMLLLFLAAYRWRGRLRALDLFRRPVWPTPATTRELWVVGAPIGAMLTFEAGFFGVVGLLMARFGDAVAGAHQVAINFAALCFMVPLSLAFASTVRVGNALGRGQPAAARTAAQAGVVLGLSFAALSAAVMLAFPQQIVGLYTDAPSVVPIAAGFLLWAAIFQVFDCLQATAAGGLRGYKDTRVPMALTLIAYWMVGMPLGGGLAFGLGVGPAALWWGIIAGLGAAAVLLLLRLWRVSRLPLVEVAPAGP